MTEILIRLPGVAIFSYHSDMLKFASRFDKINRFLEGDMEPDIPPAPVRRSDRSSIRRAEVQENESSPIPARRNLAEEIYQRTSPLRREQMTERRGTRGSSLREQVPASNFSRDFEELQRQLAAEMDSPISRIQERQQRQRPTESMSDFDLEALERLIRSS